MKLLDERWTMLVVRELLAGSTHFNDLRRGNPKMSPALLSKCLRTLERAGVVQRRVEGTHSSYMLTPSGQELRPAVEALAAWGTRWIAELGDQDLDPHLLMWDIRRSIPIQFWPRGRTVVAFRFDDIPHTAARSWVCVNAFAVDVNVDVCDFDPGFEVAATLSTSLRTMVEIWRGDRSWSQAQQLHLLEITGMSAIVHNLPTMLGQMATAAVPQPDTQDSTPATTVLQ